MVWAYNRATCRATRCASRCSGWQGRSAAGVTLPVVKGVRGSPSADAVREGSAGADPKSDRSIVPRNAREKKLRSRVWELYDLYTRGGIVARMAKFEWRGKSGKAGGVLTTFKGRTREAWRSMMRSWGGRNRAGERFGKVGGVDPNPNCGGEGQETRTVAGRDLVFS